MNDAKKKLKNSYLGKGISPYVGNIPTYVGKGRDVYPENLPVGLPDPRARVELEQAPTLTHIRLHNHKK